MNPTLLHARLFDEWVGRALSELRHLLGSARPTTEEREARAAVGELQARIRRYEREQPGYAADLQVALQQAERQLALLTARRAG